MSTQAQANSSFWLHQAVRWWLARPSAVFALLAAIFGLAAIAGTPPLRGPDETAHFLRAYGFAHGQFLATQTDQEGRKGLFVPAALHVDLDFFNGLRHGPGHFGSFSKAFAEYARSRDARAAAHTGKPVFWLYEGSEGYSPAPYVPAIAAAAVADIAGLDFLATLYLMRFAGLVANTAIIAYAIARLPCLQWVVLAIAMLPASIYGRAVLSADGAALAYALAAMALALEAAVGGANPALSRSLWTMLSALSKPPQIAFAMLEAMTRPWRDWRTHWRAATLAVLPALIACPLWIFLVGGDMGGWRIYAELPREHFQAAWKLNFLLMHPLHFPMVLLTSLDASAGLWQQLIGVPGWLDTVLHPWAYPVVSALLVGASLERLTANPPTRRRVALVAGLTGLAYWLCVFIIFFITSTPIESERIHGVQGRYFNVMLPLLALVSAALLPRGLARPYCAGVATIGAVVSGAALIEAILRTDWP